MSETHPAPDPITIRPRLHRQSPSMRELRTKKTRTTESRNVLPRLLTSLQARWLMDLREPQDANGLGLQLDYRTKKISARQNATSKAKAREPGNGKAHRFSVTKPRIARYRTILGSLRTR